MLRENAIAGAAADATDKPALWFLPASGDVTLKDGSKPPLIVIHPDDRDKLVESDGEEPDDDLPRHRPVRLAAASDYRPEEVSVQFLIKRQDSDAMRADRGLDRAARFARTTRCMSSPRTSSTRSGRHQRALYRQRLFDHPYRCRAAGAGKQTLKEGLLAFTDTSFGMERMIAVLTEAPPQSEKEDLSFLAQDGVPSATRAARRSPASPTC